MTNANKIRTASDEELVQYLIDRVDMIRKTKETQIWIGKFDGIAETEKEAATMELAWLRSEV